MQFDFEGQTGVIKDKVTGERCVIVTQTRMQDILSRLSVIFQSGAKVIVFEASKAAGEHFAKEASETTKADRQQLLNKTVQRFTDAGLGKIEVTESNLEEGEVKFRIWNNFFAEIKNEEGATYCNCIEGFVTGMYEQVLSKTPKIKKTKCSADGDPYCEWNMTLK
jgi:predicted hydrocarbon binding protein